MPLNKHIRSIEEALKQERDVRSSVEKELALLKIALQKQQEAERKLEEQRFFYEAILNTIPAEIVVIDTEQRYQFISPSAVKDPEMRAWMLGKTDADYWKRKGLASDFSQKRKAHFERVIATSAGVEWEEEKRRSNGDVETHLRMMHPILNEDGSVKMMIGYGMNITERKQIEEGMRRSEKRFRELINHSQALICTHDTEGRVQSVNPAMQHALQYDDGELIGMKVSELLPDEYKSQFETNYLNEILKNGRAQGVFKVVSKFGKKIYLLYQNYKVAEEGMEPYIVGFATDITQRILAEQELIHAKRITEEAAKTKETFLANMSHEIRTPMNGILGIAGLMAKTALEPQQRNYLKLIQDSANNLLVIVNDILDLEKIEAGRIQLEEIPFNIKDKVTIAIQSFTFKAEEKSITLKYTNQLPEGLLVSGDPYRLTQVLNNFLSNAMKFTEMGSITVTTNVKFDKEDWVAIEFLVEDSGIGIPKDKLQAIFDPFVQANADTTRKYGGTGLGLSICKNLIEMQGGELWVESEEGKGTSFRFIIPYKRADFQPKEELIEAEKDINYESLGRRSVLVAEDVELNQFLARHIMESWGFRVCIAENGRVAVEQLEANAFDLILMDIQMPEMDGIQATQYIRKMKDPVKSTLPIIALTANALKGDSEKYMAAGMSDYLSKPFTEENLFTVIKRNLKSDTMDTNAFGSTPATGASQNGNGAALYDLSMVRSVSGGDESFIRKMVELFLETVPPGVTELKQATQAGEWDKVGKLAHKLKSTIDSMGINSLKDDIRAVEANGKHAKDTEQIPALVSKVDTVVGDVIAALKSDFGI